MKKISNIGSATFKTLLLLSGIAFIPPAYGQVLSSMPHDKMRHSDSSETSGKRDYFIKQLTPPTPISYANEQYRKKIVSLKWYDNGRPQSAIVNLSQSFDIYGLFEEGSATLSSRAKTILNDLGQAITSEGINTRMYALAAHTDASGRNSTNQALTTKRAKVVKAYLQDKFNINSNRLRTVGFGSYNLKDKKNPKDKKNDRFEVCLIEDIYNHTPSTTVQLPKNSLSSGRILTSAAKNRGKPVPAKIRKRKKTDTHKKHAMKKRKKMMPHKSHRAMKGQKSRNRYQKEMTQKHFYNSDYEADYPTEYADQSYDRADHSDQIYASGHRTRYQSYRRNGRANYNAYNSYNRSSGYGTESCKR